MGTTAAGAFGGIQTNAACTSGLMQHFYPVLRQQHTTSPTSPRLVVRERLRDSSCRAAITQQLFDRSTPSREQVYRNVVGLSEHVQVQPL